MPEDESKSRNGSGGHDWPLVVCGDADWVMLIVAWKWCYLISTENRVA
jgi:hypothetical protein